MTIEEFHYNDVEWGPLEAILPLRECDGFMYMGWLEVDGGRLHHYKHSITRRYLFVNDALETYRYTGGEAYVPQARIDAILHVLEDLVAFGCLSQSEVLQIAHDSCGDPRTSPASE